MICNCHFIDYNIAAIHRIEASTLLGCESTKLCLGIALSLSWEFGFDIDIYCDQWFAVAITKGDIQYSVECDSPLDGMIFLWKRYLFDNNIDYRPSNTIRIPSPIVTLLLKLEEVMEELDLCVEKKEKGEIIPKAKMDNLISRKWKLQEELDTFWGVPDIKESKIYWSDMG
jgi:hypothetical protein